MRVKVFDPSLYINDTVTPLSVTMQPATVVDEPYWEGGEYNRQLIDVVYDYNGKRSNAHFLSMAEIL